MKLKLTFATVTFLLFGCVAGLRLFNALAGHSLDPVAASMPQAALLSIFRNGVILLSSLLGVAAIALSARSAQRPCLIAAFGLMGGHLLGWLGTAFVRSQLDGVPMLTHVLGMAGLIWIALLILALLPNNSSQPTPLRGAAQLRC